MPTSPENERLKKLRGHLAARHALLASIRAFFDARGFLEVDTPVRLRTPALELHIDAEPAGKAFLRTSPEFHMKRLLAAGYDRIYQVGPCFRRSEKGDIHHPEFAMLEWYRRGADYLDMLVDTKALVTHVAEAVLGGQESTYRGEPVAFSPVWELFSVTEVFLQFAGWDPVSDFDARRFDLDLAEKVEPRLPRNVPVVLKDYPVHHAALAAVSSHDPRAAERWELYLGGMEIANAYTELTDPGEHRRRFEAWGAERRRHGREVYALDEPFLECIERGLPACGGVALGVDRLLMVLCDATTLDEVLGFREPD